MEKGWDVLFGSSDGIFFGGGFGIDRRFECMRQFTGELVWHRPFENGLENIVSRPETFRLHQLEIFLVSPDDGGAPRSAQWIIKTQDLSRIGFIKTGATMA